MCCVLSECCQCAIHLYAHCWLWLCPCTVCLCLCAVCIRALSVYCLLVWLVFVCSLCAVYVFALYVYCLSGWCLCALCVVCCVCVLSFCICGLSVSQCLCWSFGLMWLTIHNTFIPIMHIMEYLIFYTYIKINLTHHIQLITYIVRIWTVQVFCKWGW